MPNQTTWTIDPAHSTVEFAVKHMMFTTVRGRFKQLTGTISADEQNPDRSHVEVEIEASSIDTGAADRHTLLPSPSFLDVQSQPKTTSHSKRVHGANKKKGKRVK